MTRSLRDVWSRGMILAACGWLLAACSAAGLVPLQLQPSLGRST